MDNVIKTICDAIQMEAAAVKRYTDSISAVSSQEDNKGIKSTFAINRMNAVEHIQNLTIELSKQISNDRLTAELLSELIGGEEDEQS